MRKSGFFHLQLTELFHLFHLKRVAFYHIHKTRFKLLFLSMSPKTGSHFWETCCRALSDTKLLSKTPDIL